MSQLMLLGLSILTSTIFIMMKHPMSMGFTLLLQTVIVCLLSSSIMKTSWFSYILFIVFLGGMLVLFIYMTSVASNEFFSKPHLYFVIFMSINMAIVFIICMLMDPLTMINNTESMLMMNTKMNELTLSLFNFPMNIMTTIMVLYLFLTLIVIVSITEIQQGPLRSN